MPARLKGAQAVVFVSSLLFFLFFRQQDVYRGLDNAMYANMAKAFRSGVQAIRIDEEFSAIPEKAAESFFYGTTGPTQDSTRSRDKAFVISPDGFSRPWFMVMHPLVASTLPAGLFGPLMGAVWLAMLFAVCARGNGAGGIGVFLVLVFATPYPMWFFRDEYAEVAGSVLWATVLLSHSAKPLEKPAEFAIAAFLAGLAMAFHRSLFLFALPVAGLLFAEAGTWRNRIAVAAGFCAGALALYLETRYVSAPYGDWTRVMTNDPQADADDVRFVGQYWGYLVPETWGFFTRAVWPALKSLGILALPLFGAGCAAIVADKRSSLVRKILPLFLLWVLSVCISRLGRDAYTGPFVAMWNFRRICPCVLAFVSLFAKPLSELVAGFLKRKLPAMRVSARTGKVATIAAAAILGGACIARNPVAYFAVEGKGSRAIAAEIGAELERLKPDLVVFDRFLAQLPFLFDDRFKVLGYGGTPGHDWGAVDEWLADVARTQRVVVVSAWNPPRAEERLAFRTVGKFDREYQSVKPNSFIDAVAFKKTISSTIMLAECRDAEPATAGRGGEPFSLSFDGGPLGMRGEWTTAPRGGRWSRPSSGFVGPLPRAGCPVAMTVETSWNPPEGAPGGREVAIDCLGGRVAFPVAEGRTTHELVFASDSSLEPGTFGEYRVSTEPPFDPSEYGIRGFPKDLGVVFHSVTISPANPDG